MPVRCNYSDSWIQDVQLQERICSEEINRAQKRDERDAGTRPPCTAV